MKLLIIEDDPLQLKIMRSQFTREGLELLAAGDAEEGLSLAAQNRPQMILLDQVLPGISGFQALEKILERDPSADVIMMSAHYSTEAAVEAVLKGASDYLEKPIPVEKLMARIDAQMQRERESQRRHHLDQELLATYSFHGVIGRSPLMLDVFSRVQRIAPHFRTTLITGETGTGKELIAKALHQLSPVASGRFVVCNCSAIVETLFESELFGHVKGAFTGAVRDRAGLFEHANGGTLFLDEIGELPFALQAKLLRAIQQQEIQVVGSSQPRKVNVRVIAATNRNLKKMISEKTFRDDLYYRLSMVEIELPRLADRKEDLPLLHRHFLSHFASQFNKPVQGISRKAQAVLARYHWPGNVRELENVLGSAVMMTETNMIDVADLPERLKSPTVHEVDLVSLEEIQRRHARYVLQRVGDNKTAAAEILGISRASLYRLIQEPAEPQDP